MPECVPVLAAPLFDPAEGRINMELPVGLTIADIVATALPSAVNEDLPIRVVLVTDQGTAVIERQNWQFVRPRPGVRVVIRVLPGDNALRSILQVVVTIAAVALGQLWAVPIAGALGISASLVSAGLTLGLSALGNLLINALIPPTSANPSNTNTDSVKQSYTISGWKNRLAPDDPVPVVLGKRRYAPPFAAISYTEVVGDLQYIRAMFNFGYGPVALPETGFKIGSTDLDEYDEVEIEIREGRDDDEPLSLYPRQVIEEPVGTDLTRPLPRNDAGDVISGAATEEPVVRYSASNASGASVIIQFPAGLVRYSDNGNLQSLNVSVRIRYRPVAGGSWTTVTTLNISAGKREAFFRQHSWEFPSRGRYEIEVTRMTDERNDSRVQDRSVLVAVQSFRPEYPLNMDKSLALVAVRVKATYQLNGALDNFSGEPSRICLDWDAGTSTWIEQETRNPASLYRYALQSNANAYPVADSGIDLDQLADWHDFCVLKGLAFNHVLDADLSLFETLQLIAAAGRATPRHDGVQWGVVIDRPQELAVDHINPRNSAGMKWSHTYLDPPHAFRIPFFDETNDYEPAERIVPWPDFSGEITLTEEVELPGKTNPDEIWIEARRRMYELLHRPTRFTAQQDGAARVATRGDLVMGSYDILKSTQRAVGVLWVLDNMIELDDPVTMEGGEDYAIRFRTGLSEEDTIGTSTVRRIVYEEGETWALRFAEGGEMPEAGTIVHFGPVASESRELVVHAVEAGNDFTSHFTLLDAAPIIDTLTEAEVPPEWSGLVGDEIDDPLVVPAAPQFTAIRSGLTGTGDADGLDVVLTAGSGSSAVIGSFQIDHRLSGASSWTSLSVPAADGGASISGYVSGDTVDLRAHALTPNGTPGPNTVEISVTIGDDDAGLPIALGGGSGVTGDVAHAQITIVTQNDDNLVQVEIYRAATGVALDRNSHSIGSPVSVAKSSTLVVIDGDATGQNTSLLPAGDYDYYLEPQNQDDMAGPLSGPFTVTVT
ncbi:MAG: phage tail protein [Roseibium sp.]|uniref:host specificity factor TipJ family phage tail protein n=1 Tax=Roseibium sp. TaxID=1936156 RepID=UPI0026098A21|nr:host specificity factor TipJ family phage tail protein [Roseibium sp.]MCV0424675.1 phage tail protein [Roseibium sp.]